MVMSLRAAGVACVGLVALTAAAQAPDGEGLTVPTISPVWQEPLPAIDNAPSSPVAFPGAEVPVDWDRPAPLPSESASLGEVPPLVDPGPAPSADVLARVSEKERQCLAAVVYHEARGEPREGQLAVAQVVLNRSRSGKFPKSICGVAYQPGQFSGFASRSGGRNARQWSSALDVADAALDGERADGVGKAMYFHATYVQPGWNRTRLATIGNHVFYR